MQENNILNIQNKLSAKNIYLLKGKNPLIFNKIAEIFNTNNFQDLSFDELCCKVKLTLLATGKFSNETFYAYCFNNIQIQSAFDSKIASENLLKYHNIAPNLTIHIYGCAFFDEIFYLYNTTKANLVIHILNFDLLYTILYLREDLSLLLNDSRVTFTTDTNIYDNALILPCDLYIGDNNLEIKNKLKDLLDTNYIHNYHQKSRVPFQSDIITKNLPYLKDEKIYKEGIFSPLNKAVIVGAGPSLEQNFDNLVKLKQQGFNIIAVDTALGYLEAHDFAPDFIITLDEKIIYFYEVTIFKKKHLYLKSTLLHPAYCGQKIFLNHLGPKYLFVTKKDHLNFPMLKDFDSCSLDTRGAVVVAATSFALLEKTKTIVFIGFDFAFNNNKTHSGLKEGDTRYTNVTIKDITVLCNDGQKRVTQRNLYSYKLLIEDVISENKDTNFYNLSKIGSIIEGCKFVENIQNII